MPGNKHIAGNMVQESESKTRSQDDEERPPILSSWRQLYLLVFLNLVVLIILFYTFTKLFS
ncbi:MAG: hypothetical protein Q8933_09080 [Bacteroidota bacterium]|nr:hypothetical protein [Bacteroidota bacterium]MDP4191062.1 hypothetical protein [Bacteroidota bacterium]MDP4195956.1 hypothetical protein [Bacteroidota bacterium]